MTIVSRDFNEFLHEQRTIELRNVRAPAGTFLSAGCAGTWYFDWIHENVGYPSRHIGVEFYTAKPTNLPDCVEWIQNTVGMMSGVGSNSVDFVFSGQNIEHLWAEDVVGFLCEANRVLKVGGLLAMDSPNRGITRALNWSHPEHTVEYTPSEISTLLGIAGFKVESMRGIWLCQDPRTGSLLPLEPDSSPAAWSPTRRLVNQQVNPDHCFCWWVEATKHGAPDRELLKRRLVAIFDAAFMERTQRLLSATGVIRDELGVRTASNVDCALGALVYGPYMPIPAGRWRATVTGSWIADGGIFGRVARLEVFSDRVHCDEAIEVSGVSGDFQASAAWEQMDVLFGVQFRLIVERPVQMTAKLEVTLEQLS